MESNRDICKRLLTITLALREHADTDEQLQVWQSLFDEAHHTTDVLCGTGIFDQLLDEIRAEQSGI